jgi:hypothetical protein
MKVAIILLICIAVLVSLFALHRSRSKWPVSKICSVCGAKSLHDSQYGYSQHAEEDPKKMTPLCRKCLIAQLEKDYVNYTGRAVVIEPAVGPPGYVFQPIKEWNDFFKDSKIGRDAESLLAGIEPQCQDCGQHANYLWIESKGLTGDNFTETLDKGISATLLVNNPKPLSLCGRCCVVRIRKALEERDISFLEVCSPKDKDDGFVVPMGY